MSETLKAPKRTSGDVLVEIDNLVASFDGIASRDAMLLGRLIQEYGSLKYGEGVSTTLTPMLDLLDKSIQKPKEPWAL